MQLAIPTHETKWLTLRAFRDDDVPVFFEILQDPDVVRYVGDRRVPTLPEVFGRAGIINPVDRPGPEVGYLLGRRWWGHGYATEAARAAMGWDRPLGPSGTCLRISRYEWQATKGADSSPT